MNIEIFKNEVEESREDMKIFDNEKTSNKFNSSNNWIGKLSEKVLNRYLLYKKIRLLKIPLFYHFLVPSLHDSILLPVLWVL